MGRRRRESRAIIAVWLALSALMLTGGALPAGLALAEASVADGFWDNLRQFMTSLREKEDAGQPGPTRILRTATNLSVLEWFTGLRGLDQESARKLKGRKPREGVPAGTALDLAQAEPEPLESRFSMVSELVGVVLDDNNDRDGRLDGVVIGDPKGECRVGQVMNFAHDDLVAQIDGVVIDFKEERSQAVVCGGYAWGACLRPVAGKQCMMVPFTLVSGPKLPDACGTTSCVDTVICANAVHTGSITAVGGGNVTMCTAAGQTIKIPVSDVVRVCSPRCGVLVAPVIGPAAGAAATQCVLKPLCAGSNFNDLIACADLPPTLKAGLPGKLHLGHAIAPPVPGFPTCSFEQAIASNKCKLEKLGSRGNDPLNSYMVVANLTGKCMSVVLPAFTTFISPHPGKLQDVMKGHDPIIDFAPGLTATIEMDTYCISTRSVATPPEAGAQYTVGKIPDAAIYSNLVKIVQTSMELEKSKRYASVALNAKLRQRKIAQLCVWKYLGSLSSKASDRLTRDALKEDLMKEVNPEGSELAPETVAKLDAFIDELYLAVETTLKEAGITAQ